MCDGDGRGSNLASASAGAQTRNIGGIAIYAHHHRLLSLLIKCKYAGPAIYSPGNRIDSHNFIRVINRGGIMTAVFITLLPLLSFPLDRLLIVFSANFHYLAFFSSSTRVKYRKRERERIVLGSFEVY